MGRECACVHHVLWGFFFFCEGGGGGGGRGIGGERGNLHTHSLSLLLTLNTDNSFILIFHLYQKNIL